MHHFATIVHMPALNLDAKFAYAISMIRGKIATARHLVWHVSNYHLIETTSNDYICMHSVSATHTWNIHFHHESSFMAWFFYHSHNLLRLKKVAFNNECIWKITYVSVERRESLLSLNISLCKWGSTDSYYQLFDWAKHQTHAHSVAHSLISHYMQACNLWNIQGCNFISFDFQCIRKNHAQPS